MPYPDFTYNIISKSDNVKNPGVFQPLRSTVEIVVVYDQLPATSSDEYPAAGGDVIADLNLNEFQISNAAPFKIPAADSGDEKVPFISGLPVHEWGTNQCATDLNRYRGLRVESIQVNVY